MKIAYFYITEQGRHLAEQLNEDMPGALFGKESLKENMKKAFHEYDGLVCIMATGIVVRILAPLFVHKREDPAVVVMDAKGKYAISLLSGHLGGANELAEKLAKVTGGEAVITTATDVEEGFAFDMFAKEKGIFIENIEELKYISSAILHKEPVEVRTPYEYEELNREELLPYREESRNPLVVIDECLYHYSERHVLFLRPQSLYIGIGCKYGMDGESIRKAVLEVLKEEGYSQYSIGGIATIPKKAKEPGVREVAEYFHTSICVVEPEEIDGLDFDKLKIKQSEFVKNTVGVASVATASAFLASGQGKILVDKRKFPGITVSIAKSNQK